MVAAAWHIRVGYKGAKLADFEKKLFKIRRSIRIGKGVRRSLRSKPRLIREPIIRILGGEFTLGIHLPSLTWYLVEFC